MISFKNQSVLSIAMMSAALLISILMFLLRPSTEIAEPEYKPVSVDAALVVKENLRIPVKAQGTVTPLRETSIQAEVSGRIIETSDNFLAGGFIAAGDVMLRIDPRDYKTRLLRAQAELESAESNLAMEKGRAQVALIEWKKLPKGSQRSQNATDLYLRKPQLEQADALLLAAQADVNTARDNLDRTTIKAPYDALIKTKRSALGQFVGAGTPLADIFSIDQAEVRLPIPQSKLEYLDLPGVQGYESNVEVEIYTNVAGNLRHWNATLHRTEGVFDERSRVLYSVARINDPYAIADPTGHALLMGSFVNASIQGRELQGLVELPRHILRAGNLLWVIDKDNILRNQQVTVLRTGGDQIYVSAGLNNGDWVCLTMMDASFTGAVVEVESTTPTNESRQNQKINNPTPAVSTEIPSATTINTEAISE